MKRIELGRYRFWICTAVYVLFLGWKTASAQQTGIYTNALYWLTTTPNAGLDFRVGKHSTVGMTLGYNPFLYPSYTEGGKTRNTKLMHWFVVSEYKYWFCRPYERWFLGTYAIYGKYNVEGMPFFKNKDARYKGWTAGGGISTGYQWALGKHFGLELSLGVGYMYLKYNEYECGSCGTLRGNVSRHWVGINKAAVKFSYYIR